MMNKPVLKKIAIFTTTVTLSAVGIGVSLAQENSLWQVLKMNELIHPVAPIRSLAEQAAMIYEKELGDQQMQQELAARTAPELTTDAVPLSPFQGIIDGADVPAPFSSTEFMVLNYWGGTIDGKVIGVYAGYRPENPAQGVIALMDDPNNPLGTFYTVSSGPVRIVSERNGVLTLQSLTNAYSFDVRTKTVTL